MGMSLGAPKAGKTPTTIAEINVTPLVDVMLVLLIIFMTTASVETTQARMEVQRRLHSEARPRPDADLNQKVPVNLPHVNADEVNLSEERKLVLSLNAEYELFLGEVKVVDCREHGSAKGRAKGVDDRTFRECVKALGAKLQKNEKLQRDKELYLRADLSIPYGRVLAAMARVREAGITKFGLIAEPDTDL